MFEANKDDIEGNADREKVMEALKKEREKYKDETPEERYKRKTADRDDKMKK